MDVMGVAFRRDLFVVTRQVYPELQDKEKLTHTRVQQKLLHKLGDNAYPFFFEVRVEVRRYTEPEVFQPKVWPYSRHCSEAGRGQVSVVRPKLGLTKY